jgi:rare lipoprotein A
MRYLLASFGLTLLLSVGASLPAAAASRDWSEEGRSAHVDRSGHQRLARASYAEVYDEDEARPRRRVQRQDRASRQRYTKHRHAHVGKQARRHTRTARKRGIARTKVVQPPQKPAQRTASAPTILTPKPESKRSLSTDGRKPSGAHGVASYYWQPQALASGGRFDPNAMTAAHKTLPFGTRVRVTHLGNGRSVEVKINDRGPYVAGRIIDLSRAAAGVIGMTAQGVARVAVEILGK